VRYATAAMHARVNRVISLPVRIVSTSFQFLVCKSSNEMKQRAHQHVFSDGDDQGRAETRRRAVLATIPPWTGPSRSAEARASWGA
jgi:hypothetical protein